MNIQTDSARSDALLRRAENLVSSVQKAVQVPARRAVLRRTVGRPPEDPRVHRAHAVVAPFVSPADDEATERALYAVAGLIAAQPSDARNQAEVPAAQENEQGADGLAEGLPRRRQNLGETLARAVVAGKLKEDTTEARLHLLCRQDLTGLHRHMPRTVAHLRADLVPIDWAVLARDLARWGNARELVAKQWLQSFHRTLARARADAHTESETS